MLRHLARERVALGGSLFALTAFVACDRRFAARALAAGEAKSPALAPAPNETRTAS